MPGAGITLATETTEWGDAPRPLVVASHATGFCKEVFHPVVEELASLERSAEVLSFDHRAHGDSDAPEPPFDWWNLGRDVLALIEGRTAAVGVGHSAGAAALLMAELLAPGTFPALVLVEPIVFPGPYGHFEHPLVDAALKRRRTFTDPSAARANFAAKPPFDSWDPRALDAYITGGLVPAGDEWRLKCEPSLEAEFYRAATAHGAWERLAEVGADVVLVAGEHSDSHPGPFLEATAQRLGTGHVDVATAATHFVPMEQPTRIARHIAAALRTAEHNAPR
jgi:pimeloyl-ACP methyl ester carboxylesterase